MYSEGQTLKITATKHNMFKIAAGKSFVVTVLSTVDEDENSVYVQLNAEDAKSPDFRANRRGDQLSIIFKSITPTFYPDWTIETADAPIVKIEATVMEQSAEPMSREDWNNFKSVYDVNVPEDSYEEYLAARNTDQQPPAENTPAISKRLVALKQNKHIFASWKQAMLDRNIEPTGENLAMGVYALIGEYKGLVVSGSGKDQATALANIVEAADRLDALGGVMTAAEVGEMFGLAEATVRQAINRGQIYARKSAGTWIMRRADAEARWGKE